MSPLTDRSAKAGLARARLCLDAMGADFAPSLVVEAAAMALRSDAALEVQIVGNPQTLDKPLGLLQADIGERIERIACTDAVAMNSSPAEAIRHGRGSSMALALDRLAEGQTDAVVSAGNTGALMALARIRPGMLPGIERPALMSGIPVAGGEAWVLDLGANINVDAERLTEFAVLGSAAVEALLGRKPRVGLLNIGSEPNKGPDVVREALRRCAESGLDLVGFVEGHDVFSGRADVVVCDGFAGNVLLKSAEGAITLLLDEIGTGASHWYSNPGLRKLERRLRIRFDPAMHNGASMLGINGIVLKSHAHASVEGLQRAIELAATEVRRGMLLQLERRLWAAG